MITSVTLIDQLAGLLRPRPTARSVAGRQAGCRIGLMYAVAILYVHPPVTHTIADCVKIAFTSCWSNQSSFLTPNTHVISSRSPSIGMLYGTDVATRKYTLSPTTAASKELIF